MARFVSLVLTLTLLTVGVLAALPSAVAACRVSDPTSSCTGGNCGVNVGASSCNDGGNCTVNAALAGCTHGHCTVNGPYADCAGYSGYDGGRCTVNAYASCRGSGAPGGACTVNLYTTCNSGQTCRVMVYGACRA